MTAIGVVVGAEGTNGCRIHEGMAYRSELEPE